MLSEEPGPSRTDRWDPDVLNVMGPRQIMCLILAGFCGSFCHNHIKGELLKVHFWHQRVKMVRVR